LSIVVVRQHRGRQAGQQQRIAPLGWNIDADSGNPALVNPGVPQPARSGVAGGNGARHLADFVRE